MAKRPFEGHDHMREKLRSNAGAVDLLNTHFDGPTRIPSGIRQNMIDRLNRSVMYQRVSKAIATGSLQSTENQDGCAAEQEDQRRQPSD
jgi:hypothetical protein